MLYLPFNVSFAGSISVSSNLLVIVVEADSKGVVTAIFLADESPTVAAVSVIAPTSGVDVRHKLNGDNAISANDLQLSF